MILWGFYGCFMVISWDFMTFYGDFIGFKSSLLNVAQSKSLIFRIKMVMFHSFVKVYQRVYQHYLVGGFNPSEQYEFNGDLMGFKRGVKRGFKRGFNEI